MKQVAELDSVSYDGDTDNVYIKFKVCEEKYKDYVLRWARQEEGRLVIKGDALFLNEKKGEMRTSRRD